MAKRTDITRVESYPCSYDEICIKDFLTKSQHFYFDEKQLLTWQLYVKIRSETIFGDRDFWPMWKESGQNIKV